MKKYNYGPYTGLQSNPHVIEYVLTADSNLNGVNITCFFLGKSTTDCVVVVHSVNSTQNLSDLMSISSYVFTRPEGGNSVSGIIDGVNLHEYQFGVIGRELRMHISGGIMLKHVTN